LKRSETFFAIPHAKAQRRREKRGRKGKIPEFALFEHIESYGILLIYIHLEEDALWNLP